MIFSPQECCYIIKIHFSAENSKKRKQTKKKKQKKTQEISNKNSLNEMKDFYQKSGEQYVLFNSTINWIMQRFRTITQHAEASLHEPMNMMMKHAHACLEGEEVRVNIHCSLEHK